MTGQMYQRYESFQSCLGARKIIRWSKFPDVLGKRKEKKKQTRKRKKENKF